MDGQFSQSLEFNMLMDELSFQRKRSRQQRTSIIFVSAGWDWIDVVQWLIACWVNKGWKNGRKERERGEQVEFDSIVGRHKLMAWWAYRMINKTLSLYTTLGLGSKSSSNLRWRKQKFGDQPDSDLQKGVQPLEKTLSKRSSSHEFRVNTFTRTLSELPWKIYANKVWDRRGNLASGCMLRTSRNQLAIGTFSSVVQP